jgi:hypothetical protein
MSGRQAWLAGVMAVLAAAAGSAAGLAADGGIPGTPSVPAVAPAPETRVEPSPVVYPPSQAIPIRFDHARHAKLGVACETCHAAAAGSTVAGDNLIPGEASCRPCHAIDRTQPTKAVAPGQGAARCDACHVADGGAGWMPAAALAEPPRVRIPRPNLKFNHKLHATRAIGCELCHAAVATSAMATRDDLPAMSLCLACHDGKRAVARCGACHPTEPDGRLKTTLSALGLPGGVGKLIPSGSLGALDGHGPTFRRDHARAASDEKACLTCHQRNECLDCHAGVVTPRDIHPADYVSLHAGDARRNVPDCSSCHRNQTFCVGCHQRTGVAPDPGGGLPGHLADNPFGTGTQLKRFHPPGWVRDDTGAVASAATASSHSFQAKRNIRSCASCHREESCLTCHSADPTRSIGVSPHGPRFGQTARCKAMSSRNRRACLKCHALGTPELECEAAGP